MRCTAKTRLFLIGCLLMGLATPALAAVDLVIHDLVQVGSDFASLVMEFEVTNLEGSRETIYISKEDYLPDYWTSPMCVGDTCWSHDVMNADFTLNGYETQTFGIHINMFNQHTSGYVNFHVSAANSPLDRVFVLSGIHEGCDILIVDDGVRDHDSVEEAIRYWGAGSHDVGFWPAQDDAPELSDLQNFPLVIWANGGRVPALTEGEQEMLSDYAAGGGGMMVAGEGLLHDICDPASPNYSPDNVTWLANTFGVEYVGRTSSTNVVGAPGDPIGGGAAFTLAGGYDPDVLRITGADPAVVSFAYGDGAAAGVSIGYGPVVLGFGLEDCGAAIPGIIDGAWALVNGPLAVGDGAVPARLRALGNYPNPFNPETRFDFLAPADGVARIEIMDPRGRVIDAFSSNVTAGANNIAYRGDDLGSGLYLYRISLGDESVCGKMTLIK